LAGTATLILEETLACRNERKRDDGADGEEVIAGAMTAEVLEDEDIHRRFRLDFHSIATADRKDRIMFTPLDRIRTVTSILIHSGSNAIAFVSRTKSNE